MGTSTTAFLVPTPVPRIPLGVTSRCLRRPAISSTTLPPRSSSIPHTEAPSTPNLQPGSHEHSTFDPSSKVGAVIVPGKFDSFHIGHRQLAEAAAKIGVPTLLSFSGMSSALRWKPRAPVVADVERDRVLRAWSLESQVPITWRVVPFDQVQDMSPERFVSFIVEQFGAVGIVCGSDWRFGRNREGDVPLLKKLALSYDLRVSIVDAVDIDGIVSSTRVRAALQEADVETAAMLLGRYHRLVGYALRVDETSLLCGDFVNMAPAPATYEAIVRVIGRAEPCHANVTVFVKNEQPYVRVDNLERIYCADCEIYIDFVSTITRKE